MGLFRIVHQLFSCVPSRSPTASLPSQPPSRAPSPPPAAATDRLEQTSSVGSPPRLSNDTTGVARFAPPQPQTPSHFCAPGSPSLRSSLQGRRSGPQSGASTPLFAMDSLGSTPTQAQPLAIRNHLRKISRAQKRKQRAASKRVARPEDGSKWSEQRCGHGRPEGVKQTSYLAGQSGGPSDSQPAAQD